MDDFALRLILAEERGVHDDEPQEPEDPPRYVDQTVVIERTDFTTSDEFTIHDETRSFPLLGEGRVDALLLISDSKDYDIQVDMDTDSDLVGEDEATFINESYDSLMDTTVELESVSAFQDHDSNDYVLNIGPIDFLDNIRAVVQPNSEITFRRQRAEVTTRRPV